MPQDRRAYALANDPRQQSLARKAPAWQDSLDDLMYTQVTAYPEGMPAIYTLGLSILQKDAGEAASRRYGDALDPYYRNADGSIDQQKLAEDNYILSIEDAYYGTRGEVPLSFYLDNAEDIDLLGPKHSEVVAELHKYDRYRMSTTEATAMQDERVQSQIERGMATSGYGRAKVEMIFNGYTGLVDQITNELGEWSVQDKLAYLRETEPFSTTAGKFLGRQFFNAEDAVPTTPEGLAGLDRRFQERRAAELAPEYTQAAFADEARSDLGFPDPEGLEIGALNRMFEFENTAEEEAMDFVMELFGGIGAGINLAADGVGWLSSPIWSDSRGENFQTRYDSIFGPNMSNRARNEAYAEALNETVAMTDDQFIMQMGLMPAMDMFDRLPQINPEEFNMLMSMAGGDEELAEFMLIDMVTHDPERRAEWIKQAQAVRDEAVVQLTQLKDENFTLGDALLDLLAVWGEGTENLATALLTGAEFFIMDKGSQIGTADFWNEIRENDTPAGVFGLEGTLIGLGLDLILPALVDPFTYVFGPRLGRGGRLGVRTLEEATVISTLPKTVQILDDVFDAGRGHSTGQIGYQVTLDTMGTTGMSQQLMAASRGSVSPITGVRPYMKTFGAVTDDVAYQVIDALIDPEALARRGFAETLKRVQEKGLQRPIEITINPETGAHALTRGAQEALALQRLGIDAIPTTIKMDLEFGGTAARQVANMTPEQSAVVQSIADGTVADAVRAGKAHTPGSNTEILGQLTDSLGTLEGVLGSNPVGQAFGKFNDFAVTKIVLDEGVAYVARNADGDVVGGVLQKGDNLNIAVAQEATGIMGDIFDLARVQGDDFILRMDGRSLSISDDALNFATRYAKELLEESDRVIYTVDEGVKVAEWAKGVTTEGKPLIDDAFHGRPRDIMGREIAFGADSAGRELMTAVYQKHLMTGGDPISGNRTAMAVSVGGAIGDIFRGASAGTIADKIGRFVHPVLANVRLEFSGVGVESVINQLGARFGGAVKNVDWFEPFAGRLNDFWMKRGEAKMLDLRLTDKAKRLQSEWDGAVAFVGGGLDDWATRLGVDLDSTVRGNHRQATDYILDLERQLDDVAESSRNLARDLNDYSDLTTIVDDMVNDFISEHIDANPLWADKLVDGKVPLELLNGGRTVDPMEALAAVAKRADDEGISLREAAAAERYFVPKDVLARMDKVGGESVGAFLDEALHSLQGRTAYVLPASPLELIAAATGGPRAMTGVIEKITGAKLAEGMHTAHTYWMLDKVLTPRTAFVVSLDELQRIWHTGGSRQIFKYMEDKAMGTTARVTRAKENATSWNALPKRWRDRMIALEEYPTFYRQLERSFMETNGVGFDELVFNKNSIRNTEYYTAARRTAGQLNSDDGFQMYLQGETAFREWFESSPKASRLRDSEFFDSARGVRRGGANWKDFYDGYNSMFEGWAMQGIKPGKKVQAREAWHKASAAQQARGSTAAGVSELPEWVLQGFERVTGNKQAGKFNQGISTISDALFQSPVDYRRGFVAEMVRKSEHARLAKLYESQNIRVLSDEDLVRAIKTNYPGLPDTVIQPRLMSLTKELFEKQDIISARFVDELVETKVISEMENMLYSFHMNSRIGRASKGWAPFGKPWADMWGFWGRELLSRPQLRGYINDTNFGNLGKIANAATERLPFNPRTAAYISRLAATDFDLDRIGDDPLVGGLARMIGLDSLDVGPTMFLPKGGDNPFMVMLPGLGIVPQAGLGWAFKQGAPNPMEDPVQYQAYMDRWGQFLPGLQSNSPTSLTDWFGDEVFDGGVVNRFKESVDDVNGAFFDQLNPQQTMLGEDWTTRIAADRQVQVLFQNDDIWAELADLPAELVDLGITAYLDEQLMEIATDASRTASFQNMKEGFLEVGVPVRADFNTQREDLASVWMESIEWMGLEVPRWLEGGTRSAAEEQADWARNQFYALEDWDRDALVVEHPAIAVNMVSMWEWSDLAKDTGIPESGLPYRSGGSKLDLERHQTMRELGYVQPISTRAFAERIIGTVLSARVQTARGLYTEAVSTINDQRWQYVVSDEWKTWMDTTVHALGANELLPFETGRELWENYGKLQEVYDAQFPGSDPLGMPSDMRSWGEKMPSDRESLRSEFLPDDEDGGVAASYPLPIVTPQLARQAAALGIDVSQGMHMVDLYQGVANEITDGYINNPVFGYIGPEYKAFLQPRSAGHQATQELLGRVLDSDIFEPETVARYRSSMIYLEEAIDRKNSGDSSWLEMREIAVGKWQRMAGDHAFGKLDMNEAWDQAYGRSLGALDWEPDEPPALRVGDNEFNPDASPVFVQRVVDGDTIDVVFRTGGLMPGVETVRVRLLGYNQPESSTPEGKHAKNLLNTQIQDAIEQGIPVSIVRDPRYGNTDMFGRLFAWVYIGEEAVYDPTTMIPRS